MTTRKLRGFSSRHFENIFADLYTRASCNYDDNDHINHVVSHSTWLSWPTNSIVVTAQLHRLAIFSRRRLRPLNASPDAIDAALQYWFRFGGAGLCCSYCDGSLYTPEIKRLLIARVFIID